MRLFNLKQLTELVPHFSLNKRMLTENFQISLQIMCAYVFESAYLCVHVEMFACVHVQVKARRESKDRTQTSPGRVNQDSSV